MSKSPGGHAKRLAALALLALAGAVLLRVAFLQTNMFIVDEFQHMHAAYLTSLGQVPYRDFFEHHTPFFYFLMAPLIQWSGIQFETLIYARYVSLAFCLLGVLAASAWARRLQDGWAAATVATLMLGSFFLFKSGAILFLDVFAVAFLFLFGWTLHAAAGRPFWIVLAGFFGGTAVLFTQKAIMMFLGVAAYYLLKLWRGEPTSSRPRHNALREMGALAAGAGLSALLLVALLGWDAMDEFFEYNVLLNLAWKARHSPIGDLTRIAGTDGALCFAAFAASCAHLYNLWRRRGRVTEHDLPYFCFYGICFGLVALPVVWTEYLVNWVAFAALVAGLAIGPLLRRSWSSLVTERWLLAAAGGFALLQVAGLVGRAVVVVEGPVPGTTVVFSPWAVATVLALWSLGVLILLRRPLPSPTARIALLGLLVVFPVVQQIDYLGDRPFSFQRERIEFVLSTTAPDEPVIYGFDGYAVFRPDLYRYWFLHDELILQLTPEKVVADLKELIQTRKPRLVCYDSYLRRLPKDFEEFLRLEYSPSAYPEIWVRNP
jgi:hypothetical protein